MRYTGRGHCEKRGRVDLKRSEMERVLLAEAVKRGNLDFLTKQGINPDYFSPHNKTARALWKRTQEIGRVPSRKFVDNLGPKTDIKDWEPESDIVDECVVELRELHSRDEVNRVLFGIKETLGEEDGWKKVMREVPQLLAKAGMILETNKVIDYAADASTRLDFVNEMKAMREAGVYTVNYAHHGINDHFGGITPGLHLYVARPGVGKTWTCLLDIWYSWTQGANVGIFSLEMDANRVGIRLDSLQAHFLGFDLMKGIMRRDPNLQDPMGLVREQQAYRDHLVGLEKMAESGECGKMKIWTMQNFRNAPPTPRMIEALAREEGLDVVLIDQLELVEADSGNKNKIDKLDEVARDLKLAAERMNIPFLVPHQMNRATIKEKEVSIANLANSDGPARHADTVCYLTRDKDANILMYDFLKSRNGPADDKFALEWDWSNGVYRTMDMDETTQAIMDARERQDEEELSEREEDGDWG
jgi:hypothetical protein